MIPFEQSLFHRYIGPDETAVPPAIAYARHAEICGTFLASLPGSKAGYRYAEGKWTVREVVGHFTDTSLIFLYRLVCIARGERQELPGFDENEYMSKSNFDSRPWAEILEGWRGVSRAVSALIAGFDAEAWARQGAVRGTRLTPHDMLRALIGHERHHLGVLKDRYGLG